MKAKLIESTTIYEPNNTYEKPGAFRYTGQIADDISIIVLLDLERTKTLNSGFFAGTVIYQKGSVHAIGSYHLTFGKELFERINEPLAIEYYD
jgi:hypothetical protein